MFDLEGKVALVAGGAGYLGKAVCKALAVQGAQVWVGDVARDRAEVLVGEINDLYSDTRCRAIDLDIGSEASIREGIGNIHKVAERIDLLVQCAYASTAKPLEELTGDEFDHALHVNVTGSFLLARATAGTMPPGGSIILFASMYGQLSPDPRIYQPPLNPNPIEYGAAKAALIQMAKYLAVHWAPRNIRVNAVAPGPFPNESVRETSPEFIERLANKVPLARVGRPDEVTGAVIFLASDESSYVTGQTLAVNGGWDIW